MFRPFLLKFTMTAIVVATVCLPAFYPSYGAMPLSSPLKRAEAAHSAGTVMLVQSNRLLMQQQMQMRRQREMERQRRARQRRQQTERQRQLRRQREEARRRQQRQARQRQIQRRQQQQQRRRAQQRDRQLIDMARLRMIQRQFRSVQPAKLDQTTASRFKRRIERLTRRADRPSNAAQRRVSARSSRRVVSSGTRQRLARLKKGRTAKPARRKVSGQTRQRLARLQQARATKTCSFHGDTFILTKRGRVPIRDIRAGKHLVWSMNEHTGEIGWKPVLDHYSSEYAETVHITVRDPASGDVQTIRSNRIHPFFVIGSADSLSANLVSTSALGSGAPVGDWVEAHELESGDALRSAFNGGTAIVDIVRVVPAPLSAYNLAVDDFHTYFVSETRLSTNVWVHNDCSPVDIAKKISSGHAFKKHVKATFRNNKPFKDIGVNSQAAFAKHIENVIRAPTAIKTLDRSRKAYWHRPSGTVVIHNPKADDGGTAFRPGNGKEYFDGLS